MGMYDVDDDGRLPIGNKEYHSFQMIAGFADSLLQETNRLERRAKLAGNGTWRDLKMMCSKSKKVAQALFDTMPRKKQKIIHAEMERMTAGVYVAPPSNLPRSEPTDYKTVPTKSLEWLVDQILQWECLCCQKEGKEQKKCEFREKLDSLYLFDIPDIRKGECPFQTMERYSRKG